MEFLFIGKTKEKYMAAGIDDFSRRLSHYIKIEIKNIKDSRINRSSPESIQIENEGSLLMQNIQGDYLVCLDRTGGQMDSPELAKQLERLEMQGTKKVTFVIGGPLGLSEKLLQKADLTLSLSKMTFTHDMTRLLLLEQLYRACTIRAGERYHK